MKGRRILSQEVWTSVLDHAAVDDVFEGRIPGVADRYDDGFGPRSHFPEVVSKCEDRPIVVDGTEVSVLAVIENAI